MRIVELSSLAPIAEGGGRLVYLHPMFPDCLLKVEKDKVPANAKERMDRPIAKRLRSFAVRGDMRSEIAAYVDARLRPDRPDGAFPVADFRGLVETDLGLAIRVQRVSIDGRLLGPTLRSLAGPDLALPEAHLARLNAFAASLFAWNLRTRDLNPHNIVLGDNDGSERFYLVDGLGDVTLIPLNTWFDAANRVELHRQFGLCARGMRLRWDKARRSFDRA